jgi:hypothetical protein
MSWNTEMTIAVLAILLALLGAYAVLLRKPA